MACKIVSFDVHSRWKPSGCPMNFVAEVVFYVRKWILFGSLVEVDRRRFIGDCTVWRCSRTGRMAEEVHGYGLSRALTARWDLYNMENPGKDAELV